MRWLSHRGGALDYQEWCEAHPGERFPVAVALGADPATILAAVTPVPDTLSEYAFAGLLRGHKTEVVKCLSMTLKFLQVQKLYWKDISSKVIWLRKVLMVTIRAITMK